MLRGICQALNSLSIRVTFTTIVPGAYPGENKMWQKTLIRSRKLSKTNHSPPISRYISKMVEDRWVHAARRLTSVEFSFDPCDIYRDSPIGANTGEAKMCKKCAKIANFGFYGFNYGKRLKIDGYMLRGVWPALNPLSIHVTFTAIVPGAYPGEAKMCKKMC